MNIRKQRGKHRLGLISTHDLVFPVRLTGGDDGVLGRGDIDRIATLIESSLALSGVLALVLASTPRGELSASEMNALTDLSYYNIRLNLDQLNEIWAQVSDELNRGRSRQT